MANVLLERTWRVPRTSREVEDLASGKGGCLHLYGVTAHAGLLSLDAKRMVCHVKGPDAESCRAALRPAQADNRAVWMATVHDAPGLSVTDVGRANVLVARRFDSPVAVDDVQAQEDAFADGMRAHRVRLVRRFCSVDRRRMICVYSAPDAESVRLALYPMRMELESVWAFRQLAPIIR